MWACIIPLSLIAHTWPVLDQSRSCNPCEPPSQLTNKLVLAWLIYLNVMSKGSKEAQNTSTSLLNEI